MIAGIMSWLTEIGEIIMIIGFLIMVSALLFLQRNQQSLLFFSGMVGQGAEVMLFGGFLAIIGFVRREFE